MDPLSITASIAGVATAGITISMGLYDLAHKIKHAPKEVADLAQELSFLSSLLRSLRSNMRDHAHLCKRRLLTDTKDILRNIRGAYSDIKKLAMDSSSNFYRLKLVFKSSKTKAIIAKIEGLKSTVNLIQNTLQLAILHKQKDDKKSDQREVDQDIWELRNLLKGLVNANIDSVNKLQKEEKRASSPPSPPPAPPPYDSGKHPLPIPPRASRVRRQPLPPMNSQMFTDEFSTATVPTLPDDFSTSVDRALETDAKVSQPQPPSRSFMLGKEVPGLTVVQQNPTFPGTKLLTEGSASTKQAKVESDSDEDNAHNSADEDRKYSISSDDTDDSAYDSDDLDDSMAMDSSHERSRGQQSRRTEIYISHHSSDDGATPAEPKGYSAGRRRSSFRPSANNQPLYKWTAPPNDTATWLYKLVFGDHSKVPLENVSNELQKWDVATPETVYDLLFKWTDCPPSSTSTLIHETPPIEEEFSWKMNMENNTRLLIAGQAALRADERDGSDRKRSDSMSEGRRRPWSSGEDKSEAEAGKGRPSRPARRSNRPRSQRRAQSYYMPYGSNYYTNNPFESNPFESNPFSSAGNYVPVPPRIPPGMPPGMTPGMPPGMPPYYGYGYPHFPNPNVYPPPPPPQAAKEPDAGLKALQEYIAAQQIMKADKAAAKAKQRERNEEDKLAKLENLILQYGEEQRARDAISVARAAHAEELKKRLEEKNAEMKAAVERTAVEMKMKVMREQEEKLKEEAEKKAYEEKAAVEAAHQVRILGPEAKDWNHQAVLGNLSLGPCFDSSHDSRHPNTLHGTLLWRPPVAAAISEMYTLLKSKGWKPLWMRGNSNGETWFLGGQPMLINFFNDRYIPQLGPVEQRAGLLAQSNTLEPGFVRVGCELVENEALQMLNLQLEAKHGDWYQFGLDMTSVDVENLIATSLLIREHRLRKKSRPALTGLTAQAPPPTIKSADLSSAENDAKRRDRQLSDTDYLSPEPRDDRDRRRRHGKSRSPTSSLGERTSTKASKSDIEEPYEKERRRRRV